MINVAEIVNDPDFAQSFYLIRSTGSFALGGFQTTPTTIPMYGVIEVAKEKELATLPEGDRISGAMAFYTSDPIYMTNVDANPSYGAGNFGVTAKRISDVVLWHNQQFRVVKDSVWSDFGYYKTIGVRMSGA